MGRERAEFLSHCATNKEIQAGHSVVAGPESFWLLTGGGEQRPKWYEDTALCGCVVFVCGCACADGKDDGAGYGSREGVLPAGGADSGSDLVRVEQSAHAVVARHERTRVFDARGKSARGICGCGRRIFCEEAGISAKP